MKILPEIEWIEPPGVRDKVLANTWARFSLLLRNRTDETHHITEGISKGSGSLRYGVYISLFPLAEWIVENWWFLFHEPLRFPDLVSGRQLALQPDAIDWVQRHCFLAAREGMLLPDLTVFRDGEDVVFRWASDPVDYPLVHASLRFVGNGEARVAIEEAMDCLGGIVEDVLERLADRNDADTSRLRENWIAIQESREEEPILCASAASIGVDPYDPEVLSGDLLAILGDRLNELPSLLRDDLVKSTISDWLTDDFQWTIEALDCADLEIGHRSAPRQFGCRSEAAHLDGYSFAQSFRDYFNVPTEPIDDLPSTLTSRCGWVADWHMAFERSIGAIEGLILASSSGVQRFVGEYNQSNSARFRLARALFLLYARQSECGLVTKAFDWDQRASRAFAAELLAPAQALRTHVKKFVDADDLQNLADKFKVNSLVIEHQINNHRLACVERY